MRSAARTEICFTLKPPSNFATTIPSNVRSSGGHHGDPYRVLPGMSKRSGRITHAVSCAQALTVTRTVALVRHFPCDFEDDELPPEEQKRSSGTSSLSCAFTPLLLSFFLRVFLGAREKRCGFQSRACPPAPFHPRSQWCTVWTFVTVRTDDCLGGGSRDKGQFRRVADCDGFRSVNTSAVISESCPACWPDTLDQRPRWLFGSWRARAKLRCEAGVMPGTAAEHVDEMFRVRLESSDRCEPLEARDHQVESKVETLDDGTGRQ